MPIWHRQAMRAPRQANTPTDRGSPVHPCVTAPACTHAPGTLPCRSLGNQAFAEAFSLLVGQSFRVKHAGDPLVGVCAYVTLPLPRRRRLLLRRVPVS